MGTIEQRHGGSQNTKAEKSHKRDLVKKILIARNMRGESYRTLVDEVGPELARNSVDELRAELQELTAS